jgi:hypothetical protein
MQKALKERENGRCKNIKADIAEGRIKNYYCDINISEKAAATIFRTEELL